MGRHIREEHKGEIVHIKELQEIKLELCQGTCNMPYADLSAHRTTTETCKMYNIFQGPPEGIDPSRWSMYLQAIDDKLEKGEEIWAVDGKTVIPGFEDIAECWRNRNTVNQDGYVRLGKGPSERRKKVRRWKKQAGEDQLSPPPAPCPFCIYRAVSLMEWLGHINQEHRYDEVDSKIAERIKASSLDRCKKCRLFIHPSRKHTELTCIPECSLCVRGTNIAELVKHLNDKHKGGKMNPKKLRLLKVLRCDSCHTFRAESEPNTCHPQQVNGGEKKLEEIEPRENKVRGSNRALQNDGKTKQRCAKCSKEFASTRLLEVHTCNGTKRPKGETTRQDLVCLMCPEQWKSTCKRLLCAHLNSKHKQIRVGTDQLEKWGIAQCQVASCLRFMLTLTKHNNKKHKSELKQEPESASTLQEKEVSTQGQVHRSTEQKVERIGTSVAALSEIQATLRNDQKNTTEQKTMEIDSTSMAQTSSALLTQIQNGSRMTDTLEMKHLGQDTAKPVVITRLSNTCGDEKKSSLTLVTIQQVISPEESKIEQTFGHNTIVDEENKYEEDEEMKQGFDPKHPLYVPHLWRSVPEYLWGLWWDICRPKLTAIHIAHRTRNREHLEKSIIELLAIPAQTLRRIRGTRNIQKAHVGLEQQLRQLSLTGGSTQEEKGRIMVQETKGFIPEGEKSKEAQRIQKATSLVHEGHTRKAVRTLLSEGVPAVSEQTIKDLKALHPPGPHILPRCPSNAPPMMNIDKEILKNIAIRELANGSAPGRSGWTGDLLKALVYDDQCLEGLAALVLEIASGGIRGRAKAALLCSVLVGLKKPAGGTRPIAMGEIFYKLAASYMLRMVSEQARKALGPSQFAFAPGGAEAAVLCLRTALLEHPNWCVMACDIKNAFNSRNRSDVLNILYQHQELGAVWKIADWAYRQPTDLLIVDKGMLVETLKSTQGVKQGDTLSSLLFALSMTKLYNDTAEAAGVKAVAVQDDIYFLGPQHAVVAAWDYFSSTIAGNTGLILNQSKTHVLTPRGEDVKQLVQRGLQPSEVSIPALGTLLTRDKVVLSNWLESEMRRKYKGLFRTISDRDMPAQVAFTLLRSCAVPVVQFWMRTTPPASSIKLAESFDDQLMQAASTILAIPTDSTVARHQLSLPVKLGGFGLRSMRQLAHAAYVSAMAQAVQYCTRLPREDKSPCHVLELLKESIDYVNENVGYEALPHSAEEFWKKFTLKPALPGLQREIMEKVLLEQHSNFLQRERVTADPVQSARWQAIKANYAGLWITTAPTHHSFRLSDNHFRAAVRIRMGLKPHEDIRFCRCQKSFTTEPEHLLSCRYLMNMTTIRHNNIRDALTRLANRLHVTVMSEPTVDYKDHERCDAFFLFNLKPTMIDVSVVHPLANSYNAVAAIPLGAALKREKSKIQKYQDRVRAIGCDFYPFVIETTGGFGPQAEKFIGKFVEQVRSTSTQSLLQGSVANYIRKTVAFALCTGNGLLYEEGIRKARAGPYSIEGV